MEYLKFNTLIKAIGGWQTETAAVYIAGYQITESRIFGQTNSVTNVSVQTSFYKSLEDKSVGESAFQPVTGIAMMGMGVYLTDVQGTVTDAKILSSTLAYYADQGYSAEIADDAPAEVTE